MLWSESRVVFLPSGWGGRKEPTRCGSQARGMVGARYFECFSVSLASRSAQRCPDFSARTLESVRLWAWTVSL
jgi:hypothetical protein